MGRVRGPQGNGSTSRQKMNSGLGQARNMNSGSGLGSGDHTRDSLKCSNKASMHGALPPAHSSPVGERTGKLRIKVSGQRPPK